MSMLVGCFVTSRTECKVCLFPSMRGASHTETKNVTGFPESHYIKLRKTVNVLFAASDGDKIRLSHKPSSHPRDSYDPTFLFLDPARTGS